jgi:hypothetical protein
MGKPCLGRPDTHDRGGADASNRVAWQPHGSFLTPRWRKRDSNPGPLGATTRDDRLRSLDGEAFGDERCVQRRIRDIRRRRASFFLDLGEQPGLNHHGRALLLRMIVGETAGLEDYGAQLWPLHQHIASVAAIPRLKC